VDTWSVSDDKARQYAEMALAVLESPDTQDKVARLALVFAAARFDAQCDAHEPVLALANELDSAAGRAKLPAHAIAHRIRHAMADSAP
jgi:hypothetical protein